MKMKGLKFGWLALGAILAPATLLAGCGGSNNGGLLSAGGSTQNGTFSGTATNLGQGRTGTFALRTQTDNTVNGTLVIANAAADRIAPRAATVPSGTYNFSGTRNGSSFTATGTSSTTPSFNYTVNGTVASSTTAGSFTFAGNINGEPFSIGGSVNIVVSGGGGGGGTGSGTFSATFAGGSNANKSAFSPIASTGIFTSATGFRQFLASFTATAGSGTGTIARSIAITMVKDSAFAVGDTLILDDQNQALTGEVIYTEVDASGGSKVWISDGGTAKITAINGKVLTLQVTGAQMNPGPSGPGFPNGATGSFTLSGNGTITSDQNFS